MIARPLACALLGATLLAAPSVRAETHHTCNGTLTALPATIGTQGVYCMTQDLATAATSGQAISINTNNVTLDCNGYKIGGLGAGKATSAVGIYANGKLNVTIRNCTIRGFETGIQLDDGFGQSGGHLIENNRLDLNTGYGIWVTGDNSTIRNNLVLNTGGSPHSGYPRGIVTFDNVDIIDNTVAGVYSDPAVFPTGGATGVETNASETSSVVGNRISGLAGGGQVFGIYNGSGSGHVKIVGNLVTGPSPARASYAGILCNNNKGVAQDNIVTGWDASHDIYNCTEASGNYTAP